MDRLCDNIVEEILCRLPAKYLHRVRATARRYNLIILSPEFGARYWESHAPYLSGVFLQSNRPWGQHSRFLAGPSDRPSTATRSVFASDLAFLPRLPAGPPARDGEIFIMHAAAGLLLCSRGEYKAVQYYVCNPVSWQWVALPELPRPPTHLSGLLSVTNNRDGSSIKCFQVALFNHPSGWNQNNGCLDLKVFSSATGRWAAKSIRSPTIDVVTHAPPFLGQSGTAYWIGYSPMDKLIAYNSLNHTIQVLPLPSRVRDTTALNRCVGERQGGGLRYAHFDFSMFQVWDLQFGGVNGVWWKLVHQVGVMELAERNPEATALVTKPEYVEWRVNANSPGSSLFSVLGVHPTADIIFLDVNGNVGAYSIEHGTIRYQCPNQYFRSDVFPYVHPAHPVEIPAITKAPLELNRS
ncbi:F-box/LRR-repeat/kelch-repeat protein At2g27520-like [Lolium perenne]|uniref:F-box/LRR-repeat/kelch-repeat protein At2g27520-like n=1 Tax=Lolium perenne TaxID=4522 RepID=UPI0021F5EBA9|nr:F-box protein At3g26010-like [Lolium perenne]